MRDAQLPAAVFPQATSYKPLAGFKNPHPGPPPREGDFVRCGAAGRGRCIGYRLQPQATSRVPLFFDSPDEAACPPRPGVHTARTAKTLSPPPC